MNNDTDPEFDSATEETLQDLISEALQMQAEGIEPPLEEICREHPELITAVASALDLSTRIPLLHNQARDRDPLLGQTLASRYRLDQAIGAGAMGIVYSGIDLELKRPIAVKILRTGMFSGPEAEHRFTREAESMALLNHPAVVTVFDRGTTGDDLPYLVMELLDGAPLSAVLEDAIELDSPEQRDDTTWLLDKLSADATLEPSWLRQVTHWIAQLAGGVQAAHDAGIFHRDIKPSNVFIRRSGKPVLIDFGIVAREDHATIADRDNALGTPAYMAPEQLREQPAPTPSLDVYGLTATLYHLLTLHAPYAGNASEVIASLIRSEPAPAFTLIEGMPRDLQAILDCGMARNPKERYPSARALADDLRAFLAHRPVQARPLSRLGRAWRGLRRSREFRAAAAVVALVLVGFGVFFIDRELAQAKHARWIELYKQVPPELALTENRQARFIPQLEKQEALRVLLDELVATADSPMPSRVLRAAFRYDHDNIAGAIKDIAAVSEEAPSPLTSALLAKYQLLADDFDKEQDVATTDLPAPINGDDCFVLAFHMLRYAMTPDGITAAADVLAQPQAEGNLAAEELRLMTTVFEAYMERDPGLRKTLFGDALDEVTRYEGRFGTPTATTMQYRGVALLQLDRSQQAIDLYGRALEMAPKSNALRLNLALALSEAGKFAEAKAVVLQEVEERPETTKGWMTLATIQTHLGDYEQARLTIDNAPFASNTNDETEKQHLLATLSIWEALSASRQGDNGLAIDKAERTLEAVAVITTLGAPAPTFQSALATAIVNRDEHGLFEPFALELENGPFNPRQIENLLDIMPSELNRRNTEALRLCLMKFLSYIN